LERLCSLAPSKEAKQNIFQFLLEEKGSRANIEKREKWFALHRRQAGGAAGRVNSVQSRFALRSVIATIILTSAGEGDCPSYPVSACKVKNPAHRAGLLDCRGNKSQFPCARLHPRPQDGAYGWLWQFLMASLKKYWPA